MDLHIVYTYAVGFTPYRCTNSRHAHMRAETDVVVREVAAADVTPAFRVRDFNHGRFLPIGSDDRARLMVAWNGQLWLETLTAEHLETRYRQEAHPVGTPFDACKHLHFEQRGVAGQVLASQTEPEIRRMFPGEMREWRNDGGAAMARLLARRAADMIVVDGTVYVRDYEPCWRIKDGRAVLSNVEPNPSDPFANVYSEYQYARDLWRADRTTEVAAVAAPHPDTSLEVLDPKAVRFNDDGQVLVEALIEAARRLGDALPGLPREAAEAFYDLRTAMAVTNGRFGPAQVWAASRIAALGDITANIPETRDKSTVAQAALTETSAAVAAALARWDRRPDDGREWQHFGLPVTATAQGALTVREVLDRDAAGRLAQRLDVDLGEAEAAAAVGQGRLFLVEGMPVYPDAPLHAAVQVDAEGNVVAALARRGAPADPAHVEAVQAHLRQVAPAPAPTQAAPERRTAP